MGVLALLLLLTDLGLGQGQGVQGAGGQAAAQASAAGAAGLPLDSAPDPPLDTDSLAKDILRGLGLHSRLPDMSKANISQAEWSRMTALYLDRVAARQRAETDAEADAQAAHPYQRKIYTFQGAELAGPNRPGALSRRRSRRAVLRTLLRMDLPADSAVDDAEVRVLARRPAELRLYEVFPGGRQLVAERNVTAPGWAALGALAAVQRAAEVGRPLLLELHCPDCQDAALNVLAEPAAHVRARRAARSDCGKDGQRCCRHSMQVEFAQIPSMEFVMQPKEFDAGLCRGRCPPRYHPAHHHALIQGLLRRREQLGHRGQRDGPRGPAGTPRVPRPCCAPARLKPLDVLFVDEDDPTRLKLSEWSDMTVVTCSCA